MDYSRFSIEKQNALTEQQAIGAELTLHHISPLLGGGLGVGRFVNAVEHRKHRLLSKVGG